MRFFAIASLVFAAAAGVFAGPVVERDGTVSAKTVLTDLQNKVAAPVVALHDLVAANDVSEVTVKPHIDEISVAFNVAIEAVKGMEAGSVPLGDILGLVSGILSTVLGVVAAVLVVADGLVQTLLAVVVGLVGTLLQVVVPLVGGLAGALVGLVLSLLAPLGSLGQNAAFAVVTNAN